MEQRISRDLNLLITSQAQIDPIHTPQATVCGAQVNRVLGTTWAKIDMHTQAWTLVITAW